MFLDTSIFDAQQYNFESNAFKTFVSAGKDKAIELLLPHPTELEIRRHINVRTAEALDALHDARKKAPFLKKWEHFPKDSLKQHVDYEIKRVAGNEWAAFKKQFTVRQLDYKDVNVAHVMAWYDSAIPPFGPGKKRKEFPDAFAIAILEQFAEKNSALIAVVSTDPDMKKACEHRTRLLYFGTLPEITEMLVLGSTELESFRDVILANTDLLHDAVVNEATNLGYYHESALYKIIESELDSVDFEEVHVVGLGKNEASLAFEAYVSTTHYLEWVEQVWDDEYEPQRRRVIDAGTVHGLAKVELDPLLQTIKKVAWVELDEAELPVSENPRRY